MFKLEVWNGNSWMECVNRDVCFVMVKSFEWSHNARPVVSGQAIDNVGILNVGTRVRLKNVDANGELVVFEGVITSKVASPAYGNMNLYEIEASDYLYLGRYAQVVLDYWDEVSLSRVIEDVVGTLNSKVLADVGVSLQYYPRDIEQSIAVSGVFTGAVNDIFDHLQSEFGLYYWVAPMSDGLKVVAVKGLTISSFQTDLINLKIIGVNASEMAPDVNGMLRDYGDRKGNRGSVVVARSMSVYRQLNPLRIEYSESKCLSQGGRQEPCIVIENYGVDLSQEPEIVFAVYDGVEYKPITVLTKRGEKRGGEWREDNRYDYTLDLDYWDRNKGKLRVFFRDEWSVGYAYIRAKVYKEVVFNPPLAVRVVSLDEYKDPDSIPYLGRNHGEIVYATSSVGDSYIDGLLFVSESEKEGRVLLINMRGEAVLRDAGGELRITNVMPGLTHPLLGRIKQVRFDGKLIECEFGTETKVDAEELLLRVKKELRGLKMRFMG